MNIAIVGSTGNVGRKILEVLGQKKIMGVKIDIKEINLTGSKNLYDENNNIIGELRSAAYSPHFQKIIGIAMIQKSHWRVSQSFKIQINNNTFNGKVCDLPFI